jgi:peptidoglycan/xylan/chitin deacetylase (PgdA/CDA1 family)
MGAKKRTKLFVYAVIFYSGLLSLCLCILKKVKKKYPAVILCYHRFKNDKAAVIPPKLYVKSFQRQLLHLKKWYDVITLDQLIQNIKERNGFSKPTVVITIDDGFQDNYDVAFPILRQLNLPATIFLTSGLVGTQSSPWIDEIALAIRDCKATSFYFPLLFGDEVITLSGYEAKAQAFHRIFQEMLYLDHKKKLEILKELLLNLRGNSDLSKVRDRIMLEWKEIKEMSRNMISFQAHTLSHPTLSKMPLEKAVFEIRESKRIIEKQLGTRVKHFAVPNGKDKDFIEELRDYCRNGGFESIATTNFGCVKEGTDPYNLPRICPDSRPYAFAVELARLFLR